MMRSIAQQLGDLIDEYIVSLRALQEDGLSIKPSPEKWSKKEILGHLIDSAESNIRRFVVAQYEDSPAIGYNQDKWVAIVNYQQWNWDEITGLWYQLNKQVCRILENMSAETAQRTCMTQQLRTLEWLGEDYIKHLRHHVDQVLELEPIPYP
jgi:hypothetical protein